MSPKYFPRGIKIKRIKKNKTAVRNKPPITPKTDPEGAENQVMFSLMGDKRMVILSNSLKLMIIVKTRSKAEETTRENLLFINIPIPDPKKVAKRIKLER